MKSTNVRGFERVRKFAEDGSLMVKYHGKEMSLTEAYDWYDSNGGGLTVSGFKDFAEYVEAYPDVELPTYETGKSVGCDIRCAEDIIIPPYSESNKIGIVRTGIKVYFPDTEAFLLLARSSTPKRGLILANGVGLFENDYYNNPSNDGEILVCFMNLGTSSVELKAGERVAQGVFIDIRRAPGVAVYDRERTGGIGSTGR